MDVVSNLIGTLNKGTSVVAGGLMGAAIPTGISRFDDDSELSTGMIILLIIIIVLFILLMLAIYKLTHSWAHVILCFLFGGLYLMVIVIYWGFTGHKVMKIKSSS